MRITLLKKRVFLLIASSVIVCCKLSAQEHWETVILANEEWKYQALNSEPETQWNSLEYNDSAWNAGLGGIGYGDGDDATLISPVYSLYLRKTFFVDTSLVKTVFLDIDYDDAFVAYINGIEVARSANILDSSPAYNSTLLYDREALMYQGGLPESYIIQDLQLLHGQNLLSVHILNNGTSSSDLSSIIYLHAKIDSENIIYNETPDWFREPFEFYSSNLPIVKINTMGQEILDEPRIIAELGIINQSDNQENNLDDPFTDYDGRISIEIRGQSSQMFPKKSFAFETQDSLGENLNASLMGMPAENDWILYAPYTDKSMLRNTFTFSLAKFMQGYSSRTQYCELLINDEYQGVYVLMEKIKRDDNRVDIAKLNADEISGDDLTGGYIFKVDKVDWDYNEGYDGWTSSPDPTYPNAMDIIYQYYYPKADDLAVEQRNYLKDKVTTAEQVLINPYFNDPNTGYNKYLNVGSFIDFMLLNELTKEVDKYRYSSYFFKKKDSKGGEIFAGPFWDFNLGYANVDYWPFGLDTEGWLYEQVESHEWSIIFWWKRLMEDAYFRQLANARWEQLRADAFSNENMNTIIDNYLAELNEAQVRNYIKWPILGTYVWPNYNWVNNTYTDEVDYFRNWLFERVVWMDENLNSTSLNPLAHLHMLSYNEQTQLLEVKLTLVDDYFNHPQIETRDFNLVDATAGLAIDNVVYTHASSVNLFIRGVDNVNSEDSFAVKISKNTLNGFIDLTSNRLAVYLDEFRYNLTDPIEFFCNKNQLTVLTIEDNAIMQLHIFNIYGQVVLNKSFVSKNENKFELALPANVYIVSVQSLTNNCSKKIIIQ